MEPEYFGIEAITAEDRAYAGSRFAEAREALFANPYQRVWGADGEPPLPTYKVTPGKRAARHSALRKQYLFRQAVERTVDSYADLRWGADGKGFRRLLHPNGVCLTGRWEITEETDYSGYFRTGSQALVIGRLFHPAAPKRGAVITRSLALAGKLFHRGPERPTSSFALASFFTQEDIGGAQTDYINDVELRNAPDACTAHASGARLSAFSDRGCGVRQS